MSPFRTAPITAECLVICTALFVVCQLYGLDGVEFRDAQRFWGAIVQLPATPAAGAPEAIGRELQGPFDLWSGEWWRIPASAFHHAHVLHLLLNCAAGWALGRRLEQRWGSFWYLLFLIPAVLIPLLAEVLLGNTPVGFSGAICAMLGAQIALQQFDPANDDIPDEALQVSLGLILAGIPASALGLVQFANAAHIIGIVYGWVIAWSCCGPGSRLVGVRSAVFAAHALLIPAIQLAMHPVGNGRYLWYMADRDPQVAPDQRTPLLERAVQADPSLTGVWLRLIEQRMIEGDSPRAWSVVVAALSSNPADADLFAAARRVWRRLPFGPPREAAEAELQHVFGEQSRVWMQQIRGTGVAAAKSRKRSPTESSETPLDPKDFPLDRPLELRWEPLKPQPDARPPVDRPDAIEGAAT